MILPSILEYLPTTLILKNTIVKPEEQVYSSLRLSNYVMGFCIFKRLCAISLSFINQVIVDVDFVKQNLMIHYEFLRKEKYKIKKYKLRNM